LPGERAPVCGELSVERAAVGVAHGAARARRRSEQAHASLRLHERAKARVGGEVLDRGTRALAGEETTQPVAQVSDEALARLLAVVADIDAALQLLRDRAPRRLRRLARKLLSVDRVAAARGELQLDERAGTREAPRVGGEDAGFAALQTGACCFLAACHLSSFSRAPFFAGSISLAWLGIFAVSSIT